MGAEEIENKLWHDEAFARLYSEFPIVRGRALEILEACHNVCRDLVPVATVPNLPRCSLVCS